MRMLVEATTGPYLRCSIFVGDFVYSWQVNQTELGGETRSRLGHKALS